MTGFLAFLGGAVLTPQGICPITDIPPKAFMQDHAVEFINAEMIL
jgi:hypothetical protein